MSDDELDPGLQGYSDSGSDFHDLPEPPLPEDVRKTASTAPPAGAWTLKRPTAGDAVKLRLAEPDPAASGYQDEEGLVCLDLGEGCLPRLEAAATSLRLGEVATFRFDKGLQGDSTASSLELTLVDWTPRVDLFQVAKVVLASTLAAVAVVTVAVDSVVPAAVLVAVSMNTVAKDCVVLVTVLVPVAAVTAEVDSVVLVSVPVVVAA
ncbi:hypothetical protein AK812_SmicGene1371 [Symbiodinium microadriaticum]|uniref:Uncharacterized protein n=1 Tax=Symbiodinium microadriaticum TaxID=2951 RepID=A0A1Q9F464_SYMMI|nr:hypothetical protein AK812_SmicGene1371 [Symbiodinium microadriaticum]